MDVHTRARDARKRFGHEGGIQALALGDRLYRVLQRDGAVGRLQSLVILEVDLVLAGRGFVMVRLDGDPELLQRADNVRPRAAEASSRKIEVAGLVESVVLRWNGAVGFEEEELNSGPI